MKCINISLIEKDIYNINLYIMQLLIFTISLGLPQLTVFTYLIYWLYGDEKPVSKKIPNLKQENKRDYQVLFTGFTLLKNT